MTSKKCVIHFRAFADRMSLREIEADVVEFSPILPSRDHFLSVNLKPFFKYFLTLGCQVGRAVLLYKIRKHELRAYDSADSNRGSEIICAVAQLNVVAEIGNIVAHELFQGLALGADLK